jgi:hypothetical protein
LKRSTLAAAAILAVLAAYIYWFEREPLSDAEGEEVFGVEEDAIDRIEIRRAEGEEAVVLERGENGFRLLSPVAAQADETEVDLLLQNLATMRFERVVAKASAIDLSDFGLDSPRIEVTFRTKDGASRSLAFGSDAPTPSNQYARRDGGEEVLVVPSHLSLNFDKSDWDLREKRIFPGDGAPEARRIDIERPAGKLALVKEGGLWFVEEPRSRADRTRAAGIASRVHAAEMKEIVSETTGELEAYGLDAPSRRVRIELEGEDSPPLELEIGAGKDSDYYARAPARSEIFVLASDLVEELDSGASELQSKKLFDFSAFAAKRMRIEAKGEAARELERLDSTEEEGWRETLPEPGRELDTTKVEDLLYALNGAEGTLSPIPGEATAPDYTLTVWSGDPLVEERVEVRKLDSGVEVNRAGEAVALQLSEEVWKEIEGKLNLEKSE